MMDDLILTTAIFVFLMLLIGIGLTCYEFKYHILKEDDEKNQSSEKE